jgi:hypothetical protein
MVSTRAYRHPVQHERQPEVECRSLAHSNTPAESAHGASPQSPCQSRAGAYYPLACHSSCQAYQIARRCAFIFIPVRSVMEACDITIPRGRAEPYRPPLPADFRGADEGWSDAELSTPYPRPCHLPIPRRDSKHRPSLFPGGSLGRADAPSLKLVSDPHPRRCREAVR